MTAQLNNQAARNTPVVALHSSASGSSQWNPLIAHLRDWHDVIAFDLPGYGKASKRDPSAKGMKAVAQPIIDEIERLKTPVHLVGHSFGGATAIKIALTRPDLVKSLTLYEPAAFHILESGTQSDRQLLAGFRRIAQILNATTSIGQQDVGMEKFIDFWNGSDTWRTMPDGLREKLASVAPTVSSDFANGFAETWCLDDLERLTIPTLILMGMDSPGIAQRAATLVAEYTPHAELAMLPGLGHMAPVQEPEWVNPRIHQHIARVEKSAGHVSWPRRAVA